MFILRAYETLQRLIEVDVNEIDCGPIEYVRNQYHDEEIILDSSDLVETETERIFATVLEQDKDVLKWMCPNIKQFNIYYEDDTNNRYQPDFIVETTDKIYMIEVKDNRKLDDEIVVKKAKAAMAYCEAATEFNLQYNGKL